MKQEVDQNVPQGEFTPIWFFRCANPLCGKLKVATTPRKKTCGTPCRVAKARFWRETRMGVGGLEQRAVERIVGKESLLGQVLSSPAGREIPESLSSPANAPTKPRTRRPNKTQYSRTCALPTCSKPFLTPFKKQRYCLPKCRLAAFRASQTTPSKLNPIPQSHPDLSRTLAAIDAIDLSSLPSLDEILSKKR